jgi:hypothetical protein
MAPDTLAYDFSAEHGLFDKACTGIEIRASYIAQLRA